MRAAWAAGGLFVAGLLYMALVAPLRGARAKTMMTFASLVMCWPALRMCFVRHAKYVFEPQLLEISYGGRLLLSVPYDIIEYTSYTAEAIPQHGVSYLPWGRGMLYVVTRPGFLVTVDVSAPLTYVSGWFFRLPVRRLLLTVDRAKPFLEELRIRVQRAEPTGPAARSGSREKGLP